MNHCLLEVEVLEAPQVRYTQDNQTPVAEMAVQMDGLRPDDPPAQLKVVGWGNLAQELQNRVQVRVEFKLDKNGNVAVPVGKFSFAEEALVENGSAFIDAVVKSRPASAKGAFVEAITLSASMSPGLAVDPSPYLKN